MRIKETVKKDGSNRIAGYVCVENNKETFIPKRTIIALIKNGRVENATIQVWNGTEIVRIKDSTNKTCSKKGMLTGTGLVQALKSCSKGTPITIRWANNLEFKQSIFVATLNGDNGLKFRLFDGSGLNGMSDISADFIIRNTGGVVASFENNSPYELARLQKMLLEMV